MDQNAQASQPPSDRYTVEDFQNLVHVSWKCDQLPENRSLTILGFRVRTGIECAVVAAFVLTGSAVVPGGWRAIVVCGAIATVSSLIYFVARHRSTTLISDETAALIASRPDPRFRLRLTAHRANADSFRGLGKEPFEPRIHRSITGPAAFTGARRTTILCCCIAVYGAVLVAARLVLGGLYEVAFYIMMTSLAGPAALIAALMWPTYFRIVPGRLDVLAYGLLGHGKPQLASIDLRTSRLLVDTNRDMVIVEREGQEAVSLTFAGVPDRLGFARSVLEAARCTVPTPPLPEDELVG